MGAGKTTLLNCISTIDRVTSGRIIIGGEDITSLRGSRLNAFRREKLGFIFQDFNLLDTLTGYENIALALSIQNVGAREIEKRIMEIADTLNIKDVLKKYTYQMSGGQKQRVASARALITNPELILADEPTGALDYNTGKSILKLLYDTCRERNVTVIVITHNLALTAMGDKVIKVKNGLISEIEINENPIPVERIEW